MRDVEQIMEYLYKHRAPALPPEGLAEVFDRLIWCLDDNGADVMRVIETWLQSSERPRVEIALALEEVFPFNEREQMETVFAAISSRWPDLVGRCCEIQSRRREQCGAR
jgi:hypothetical protein